MASPEAPTPFMMADGAGGQRLCLHHTPSGSPTTLVLQCHALAQEMHFARRSSALAARALARAGAAVLQMDLRGCGDSSGRFEDATWADWLNDLARGAQWLQDRHPGLPLWLWGQRAGALLAVESMACGLSCHGLILWQPLPDGETALRQMFRLQSAAALAEAADARTEDGRLDGQEPAQGGPLASRTTARMDGGRSAQHARSTWQAGGSVILGGYAFNPELARALQSSTLKAPAVRPGHMLWLETRTRTDDALPPATEQRLDTWRAAGWRIDAQTVAGPSFWTGTGAGEVSALVDLTCSVLAASPLGASP